MRRRAGLAIAAVLPALAPTAAAGAAKVDGSVGVVSDYRFRGVSLSGTRPAVQATLRASAGPVYVEAFATTSARTANGARVETDLTAGAAQQFGKTTVGASVTHYLYPGDRRSGYVELLGHIDRRVGPATFSLVGGYAPPQGALWHKHATYLAVQAQMLVRGTTLFGAVGRERGALLPGGKLDWQVGARRQIFGLEASAVYVDSNRDYSDQSARHLSRSALVFGLGYTF